MKISTTEKGELEIKEVYNGITLVTNSGEKLSICMRDSGFEFTYQGEQYYAKNGILDHIVKQK